MLWGSGWGKDQIEQSLECACWLGRFASEDLGRRPRKASDMCPNPEMTLKRGIGMQLMRLRGCAHILPKKQLKFNMPYPERKNGKQAMTTIEFCEKPLGLEAVFFFFLGGGGGEGGVRV